MSQLTNPVATTPPISSTPQDQVKVELVQIGEKALVTIGHKTYVVTVSKLKSSQSGTEEWEEVKNRDWKFLESIVNQLFKDHVGETFKGGLFVLQGDFKDIETAQKEEFESCFKEKEVTIIKSQVSYAENDSSVKTVELNPLNEPKKVTECFDHFAKEVASKCPANKGLPPSNSSSSTPTPQTAQNQKNQPANQSQVETVTIDERLEICEGRAVDTTMTNKCADEALLHQLQKMNRDSTVQNAQALRATAADHIRNNKNAYCTNLKFQEVLSALIDANTKESSKLTEICKANKNHVTPEQLRNHLILNSQLTEEVKKRLVDIYVKYIQQADSICLGAPFFRAIVEHAEKVRTPLDIVVISSKSGQKAKSGEKEATSYHSSVKESVATANCAFLRLENDGTYSSYNRAADPTKGIEDLNGSTNISATSKPPTTRERLNGLNTLRPVNARFTTTEVTSDGRCLDMSLAYQQLKKIDPNINKTDQRVTTRAKTLREGVANHIRKNALDPKLLEPLKSSIQAIPTTLPTKIYDIMAKIKRINSPENTEVLTNDEKTNLANFYANYIIAKDQHGNMTNYLDSVFLLVLPEIEADLKCVLVQGDRILATYPPNLDPSSSDVLFINYNGVNHYTAILRGTENDEKLAAMTQPTTT